MSNNEAVRPLELIFDESDPSDIHVKIVPPMIQTILYDIVQMPILQGLYSRPLRLKHCHPKTNMCNNNFGGLGDITCPVETGKV